MFERGFAGEDAMSPITNTENSLGGQTRAVSIENSPRPLAVGGVGGPVRLSSGSVVGEADGVKGARLGNDDDVWACVDAEADEVSCCLASVHARARMHRTNACACTLS